MSISSEIQGLYQVVFRAALVVTTAGKPVVTTAGKPVVTTAGKPVVTTAGKQVYHLDATYMKCSIYTAL
jgi:hypothetical protein